ncbi:hypothetical protein QWL27_31340 [Streptomyces thermocarboxydus]|uniref:hypothetical protein n=1 Tax=Streptomyces TaxID=1883 RepID=UPI0020C5E6C3|nr:hypothetical protein [Streptomyces sp. AC04842]MDN3290210.1 hypothetical protein [Streptomyces thermocarboxydus]
MSDEIGGALRELAAFHETPPPLPAREVRARANRRSRRRRATLALGTMATAACAVTVVTFALHTDPAAGKRHRPGATPATSPTPARTATASPSAHAPHPSGRLDVDLRTLTLADRVLKVDLRAAGRFPPGTRLTVVARTSGAVLPLKSRTETREVKVPYLVELRAPGGEPVYAGALSFDAKVLRSLSGTTGWVGLSARDAEWLHDRLRDGDQIELAER